MMPSVGEIIGFAITLVSCLVVFGYGYGKLTAIIETIKSRLEEVSSGKLDEVGVLVAQHEKRLDALGSKLDKVEDDLSEMKGDLKVIRAAVEQK